MTTDRTVSEPRIDIEPLAPQRLTEFLAFFDGPAFADNPRWASCYCQCFYEDHDQVVWKDRTGAQNRARACERQTPMVGRGLAVVHQRRGELQFRVAAR